MPLLEMTVTGAETGFAFPTLQNTGVWGDSLYEARMIADSISAEGVRLSTMAVTYPRFILAEFNTHRALSRSSASSRAVPVAKMLTAVRERPFVPERFTVNQSGMQATEVLDGVEHERARTAWLSGRDHALITAQALMDAGVHKQQANRVLEPYLWNTTLVTATEWSNLMALRAHPDAQPEFQTIALMMQQLLRSCKPTLVTDAEWHLPFVRADEHDEFTIAELVRISTGRSARVSYLDHDGRRDPAADLRLHDRLLEGGHMSPMEHVAKPAPGAGFIGNHRGWRQYRKTIPSEHDFALLSQAG